MNDTEEAVRRLFAAATEDMPPGIDLLRGVRTRSRTRVVRARVVLCAGLAGIAAAATATTLAAVPAPSALAQVTQAAARTAGQSYQVSATSTPVTGVIPGVVQPSPVTMSGEFDPARGVGEVTIGSGFQARYLGRFVYLPIVGALRDAFNRARAVPIPAGKSWLRLPAPPGPGGDLTVFGLTALGATTAGVAEANPQDLLSLLKSASQVREVGPASGPGWTGSAYTFTATMTPGGPLNIVVRSSGTVEVDRQGRVRQLDTTETTGTTERKLQMTFGDFGVPVSVSAPPASETFTP